MLDLFEYPVMLSNEAFINISSMPSVDKDVIISAHIIIYDFLIYPTFNSDIKDRIIVKYIEKLKKPLLKALYQQALYIVTNGGDISTWNGIIRNSGSVDKTEVQEVLTKIICPQAINILKGAPIDLLYAGG